jgi:hypothetical protein
LRNRISAARTPKRDRLDHAALSSGDDLITHHAEANYSRTGAFVEVTANGVADIGAQLFHTVGLRDNGVTERLGDVSALGVLFDRKYDLAAHRGHLKIVYRYTGTGTPSTISRKISSACCDFFKVDE